MHRRNQTSSGRIQFAVSRPMTSSVNDFSIAKNELGIGRHASSVQRLSSSVRSRHASISNFNRPFSSLFLRSSSPLKLNTSEENIQFKDERALSLEIKVKLLGLPSFDPLASVLISESKDNTAEKKPTILRSKSKPAHFTSSQEIPLSLTDNCETSFNLRACQALRGHVQLNYAYLPGKVEIDSQVSDFFFEVYFSLNTFEAGKRPDITFIQKTFAIKKRANCHEFWFVFRVLEPAYGQIGFYFADSKHRELDVFEKFAIDHPSVKMRNRPCRSPPRPSFDSYETSERRMLRLSQETSRRILHVRQRKQQNYEDKRLRTRESIKQRLIQKEQVILSDCRE